MTNKVFTIIGCVIIALLIAIHLSGIVRFSDKMVATFITAAIAASLLGAFEYISKKSK
jgi:hypothetical protein